MDARNKTIVFFIEDMDYLNNLTDDQAGKLFKGIAEYHTTGKLKEYPDDPVLSIVYKMFIKSTSRQAEKYIKAIDANERRSEKMRGNQNAKKATEPEIVISPSDSIEKQVINSMQQDDIISGFTGDYDDAKHHYSFYFSNYLTLAGGDESIVKDCFERVKNTLHPKSMP